MSTAHTAAPKVTELQTIPVGMKRFSTLAEAETVERLRRPPKGVRLATDQIVGQARWLGYTIGVTGENLLGQQCAAVVGLAPRDETFLAGERYAGVWYGFKLVSFGALSLGELVALQTYIYLIGSGLVGVCSTLATEEE